MNVTRLESFVAIVDGGSISAAARRLGVGQPAVSKHLKALELEFGVELFSKKTAPMNLTPAGQKLLPIARKVVRALLHARKIIQSKS